VVPIGYWSGASLVIEEIPQSSFVITEPKSTPEAKHEPESALIVIL